MKLKIKNVIFGIIVAICALNASASLDSVSQQRLDDYVSAGILPANTDKGQIRDVKYDQYSKTWKKSSTSFNVGFSGFTLKDCENWDFADLRTQEYLYWLNNVAMERQEANIEANEALSILKKYLENNMENFGDRFFPLEAFFKDIKDNFTGYDVQKILLLKGFTSSGKLRRFDFNGTDFEDGWKFCFQYPSDYALDTKSRFYNPDLVTKNISHEDLIRFGIFYVATDFRTFTSDELSCNNPSTFANLAASKFGNVSLYNSKGEYIFKSKVVQNINFSDFKDATPKMFSYGNYFSGCTFPPMTLTGQEDFSRVTFSGSDLSSFTGLTFGQFFSRLNCGNFSNLTQEQYDTFLPDIKQFLNSGNTNGHNILYYRVNGVTVTLKKDM